MIYARHSKFYLGLAIIFGSGVATGALLLGGIQ